MEQSLKIGSDEVRSVETVESVKQAIVEILQAGGESKTIRTALDSFRIVATQLAKVENVTVQNCEFTNKEEANLNPG